MNENRNNSYLFSSNRSSTALRTCTSCCPFDNQNVPHPQFNYSSINQRDIQGKGIITNTDTCCLSKLQVDCHIQCHKKKKKHKKMKKNKRYDSIHSSQNTKRSISSSSSLLSSQLSTSQKRKKVGSSTNTNSHYIHNYDNDSQTSTSTSADTNESEITEQSFSSNESNRDYRYHNKSANAQQHHTKSPSRLHINKNIQNLKTSIDNLTQVIIHQQNPSQTTFLSYRSISLPLLSFLNKFRRFFSSSQPTGDQFNEECSQILQHHHLTKQNLLSIYYFFDKNEKIFLNWLRTIMPEYFLPLLLSYVKHFDSISTDND